MPLSRNDKSEFVNTCSINRHHFRLLISAILLIVTATFYEDAHFLLTAVRAGENGNRTIRAALLSSSPSSSSTAACDTLSNHMKGKWQHTHPHQQNTFSFNSSKSQSQYLPHELNWLLGSSDDWKGKAGCDKYSTNQRGFMYASPMGNQCNCGTRGFKPSHSTWIWDQPSPAKPQEQQHYSPSFEMVQRLARENKTICFAGDSIDLQFYFAIVNNLMRHWLFLKEYNNDNNGRQYPNVTVEQRSIPVVYTNETTGPMDYAKFWMCMQNIIETIVSFSYNNGETHSAALRYYKVYGWSPWNFIIMENSCDVLIYTLGIHYDAHGDMIGKHYGNNKFVDDFQAAITHLAEFNARDKDKIAIWRSVLPQHFDAAVGDGHYPAKNSDTTCTAFNESGNDNNADDSTKSIQNFNKVADEGFSKHCNFTSSDSCNGHVLQHRCSMNVTSTNYRTIYKHLLDNNVTSKAAELKNQYPGDIVKGNILHWNIANLFNVPEWHSADIDCSHFCYIPNLYEEAFERLNWLLLWSNERQK